MNECVKGFVHIVPKWTGVPFGLYNCHMSSAPGIGSWSTITLQDKAENEHESDGVCFIQGYV